MRAVERISEIRVRRQERYYEKRMASVKGQRAAQDKQQLEREIHLVKAPESLRTKGSDKGSGKEKSSKQKLKVAAEGTKQRAAAAGGGGDAMQE